MSIKVNLGDVFTIPFGDGRYGVGQIVSKWREELYIVVYGLVSNTREIEPEIVNMTAPLFSALSLDAKLWKGDWQIIGNIAKNLPNIRRPVFKIASGDSFFLESQDHSLLRKATPEEVTRLRYRTVVAPIRLEKALRAYNNLEDWNPKYDELFYDYAVQSSELLTE